MAAELTIIYVNFRSKDEIARSLASVDEFTTIPYEVIVVNNSSDEDLSDLRLTFRDIKLINSPQNDGFGRACNVGIKSAITDYILLLNPDTLLSEDAITESLAAYKEQDPTSIGALTCRHVYENGQFQYSTYGRTDLPVFPFIKLPWRRVRVGAKAYFDASGQVQNIHGNSHYTYGVHGSFLMAARTLLVDEPFDHDFFLYGEEIDLCRRLYQKGKRAYYFAGTSIVHSSNRAIQSQAIRNQNYLSTSLLVLKFYGRAGFLFYHSLRLLRASLLWLLLPFLGGNVKDSIVNHLSDALPFSRDHFKVLRYRKRKNSHEPLISSNLR